MGLPYATMSECDTAAMESKNLFASAVLEHTDGLCIGFYKTKGCTPACTVTQWSATQDICGTKMQNTASPPE